MPPNQAARLLDAMRQLGRPASLTAPRAVLREATLVAIDEAGETLSGHCTRLLRGEGSVDQVRTELAELGGLIAVLEQLERN